MSTQNITGTATNAAGLSSAFTGTITIVDAPVVHSVTVSPASAPPGTARTITISADDPNTPPQTLTYTCKVNGVDASPTGTPGVFTFTP